MLDKNEGKVEILVYVLITSLIEAAWIAFSIMD